MTTVEQLYKDFGVLADADEEAGEHKEQYLSILSGVKAGASEKRLSSQFIARFFKFFPSLAAESINALFDLCEDDDVNIRKQAIKDLPNMVKDLPVHVPKIAEAMIQLLQCNDNTELSLVHSSLVSLLTTSPKGTLEGIFTAILNEEDEVREKAIKFLSTKVRNLSKPLDAETEEYILVQSKKVLQDVTKDEFIAIINMLKSLSSMKSADGRKNLVQIVVEQAELDQPFEASDADCVDRLMSCIRQVLPIFSKGVHSATFVCYMCDHVLPVLSEITTDGESSNTQLEVLKVFAEISEFCGEFEKKEDRIEYVYSTLVKYMPLPPAEDSDEVPTGDEPKLQFSTVECLLFAFHNLGQHCESFLTDEKNAERLKDFRLRLQYFARGLQVYIKQLKAALLGKSKEALKTDENKIKVVALKTTSNINNLIRDLFHNPPSYKAIIVLSWKPAVKSSSEENGTKESQPQKRFSPITYSSQSSVEKKVKKPYMDMKMYAPPSGKFSDKAGTYDENRYSRGGRGRGRRRGGFNRSY